mmetsp:Transcript_18587/g.34424  ORF Transcript_18587/g.34424 Transcript_18587/m.34424 type:complete len:111 (-) Transcript_18587:34-366(-)|eukprot:CAMPEP_0197453990 /NCGR_PEP_ID=MMETSP1175-20131217/36637_1 /TAXON_ID=1003142 /ORGANISM="Triceratium dubium, Strain CCMP147" /LENGTH=110 /DNA_ID=CAMNT_0042987439 /DNA_START=118 /DNA_END=450 /DNA_ORIENTATION=+
MAEELANAIVLAAEKMRRRELKSQEFGVLYSVKKILGNDAEHFNTEYVFRIKALTKTFAWIGEAHGKALEMGYEPVSIDDATLPQKVGTTVQKTPSVEKTIVRWYSKPLE